MFILFNLRIKRFFPFCAVLIFYLILGCSSNLFAQEIDKTFGDVEFLILKLYRQQQTADVPYQDFYEAIYQFYQNPLDLNSANSDELANLYVLSNLQIAEIISHRKNNGPFVSVYELQSIESLDLETLELLLHFVKVNSEVGTWRGLKNELRQPDLQYLIFRHSLDLERSRGYLSQNGQAAAYEGDPHNLYMRYRFQKFNLYSVGFTSEKDAGEKWKFEHVQKKYGTDFISAHAVLYNMGRIKRWAIGDYQLQYGQGLVMSGGFFLGKGSETILAVRRNSTGIRPYSSVLETGYFRGTALTLDLNRVEFTPFFSRKYIDGSIQLTDSASNDDLATLRYTGLHRTATELAARKTVLETAYGLNANYQSLNKNLHVGANLLRLEFDKTVLPAKGFYNFYDFKGEANSNYSLYYSYFLKNISLFGEAATSLSGGKGIVQGALVSLGSRVDVSMMYRNYAPNLHTHYGNSFGENYKNSNEKGFYWGIKIRLTNKTELNAFYDLYMFPWLKYRVSAPSSGAEQMLAIRHKFNKKALFMAQFRTETKEMDAETANEEKYLISHTRQFFMAQFEYKIDRHFYLKSRFQQSSYSKEGFVSHGSMIAQDFGYDGRTVDFSLRCSLFDTDDFENRQYMYEKDVLYSFSFPFFTGKGMRQYMMTKINLTSQLTFWLKYGRTTYFDREEVGSGYEQVLGNIRSEIKLQLRYTF